MSTIAYTKPFIARVDRAPVSLVSQTLTQNTARTPIAPKLKPLPLMGIKPHVPPVRNNFVRGSGDNAIKLP